MEKQSFNLNADFVGGYTGVFLKIVMAIILVYSLLIIIQFLRDKFIKKESPGKDPEIIDLLIILNKLFYVGGFGFIIANFTIIFFGSVLGINNNRMPLNLRGDWDYLIFGIILIFMGIGFEAAKKVLVKEKQEL